MREGLHRLNSGDATSTPTPFRLALTRFSAHNNAGAKSLLARRNHVDFDSSMSTLLPATFACTGVRSTSCGSLFPPPCCVSIAITILLRISTPPCFFIFIDETRALPLRSVRQELGFTRLEIPRVKQEETGRPRKVYSTCPRTSLMLQMLDCQYSMPGRCPSSNQKTRWLLASYGSLFVRHKTSCGGIRQNEFSHSQSAFFMPVRQNVTFHGY